MEIVRSEAGLRKDCTGRMSVVRLTLGLPFRLLVSARITRLSMNDKTQHERQDVLMCRIAHSVLTYISIASERSR